MRREPRTGCGIQIDGSADVVVVESVAADVEGLC